MIRNSKVIDEIKGLLETMHRLLDPDSGCLWDLQQTHKSLKNGLLEETYEALEAIDSEMTGRMTEEFGDLLIQVVFHSEMGERRGAFSLADIAKQANDKLIRRHPHVFGDNTASSPEEVKNLWDRVKAEEREEKGKINESVLDGIPRTMPALAYAQAMLERADRAGRVHALEQGISELTKEWDEIAKGEEQARKEGVLGATLLLMVDQARKHGVDAEHALGAANKKFYEKTLKSNKRNGQN